MTRAAIEKLFGYKAGRKLYNLLYSSCNNFCCIVKDCLGISDTGNPNLLLNQQGDWVLVTGSIGGLFAQTTASIPVANTITESSLIGTGVGYLSVPANGFQIGDSFHAKLIGNISSANNNNIQIRIKSNGILLADTGIITLPNTTNRHWEINVYFTIQNIGGPGVASIASGGIFSYVKNASTAFEGANFNSVNNTTFDTTINNTLEITAQWGSANPSNSIYSQIFILNKMF